MFYVNESIYSMFLNVVLVEHMEDPSGLMLNFDDPTQTPNILKMKSFQSPHVIPVYRLTVLVASCTLWKYFCVTFAL